MATIYCDVLGIAIREPNLEIGDYETAEISVTLGAYNHSTDTAQIGGGGTDRGSSTTSTLAAMIESTLRDAKTITLKHAMLIGRGLEGTTNFYTGAFTVSAGNLTFNLTSADEATGIDASAGVYDHPLRVLVAFVRS